MGSRLSGTLVLRLNVFCSPNYTCYSFLQLVIVPINFLFTSLGPLRSPFRISCQSTLIVDLSEETPTNLTAVVTN